MPTEAIAATADITRPNTKRIAELNDQMRTGLVRHGCIGRATLTIGVQNLLASEIEAKGMTAALAGLFGSVANYDRFERENDPYHERDFGDFTWAGTTLYWKIDYFDHSLMWASEQPDDTSVTVRVLTIMRSDEY